MVNYWVCIRPYCVFAMVEKKEIIKLSAGMRDPKGILIPRGVNEQLSAEIADEVATFRFKDGRTTKRFAAVIIKLEQDKGEHNTVYFERMGKIITQYPGKSKEEIRDLVLSQLKQLGANAKNG